MAQVGQLPFNEAIDFIKGKIDLPTKSWADITDDMHGRGFVVAGAMKQEIVADFHSAILRAVEDGTDITEFRKQFDSIVSKNGWTYNGKRGWRSSIILDTNLSTAYSAGREKQRRVDSVLKAFPNDEYKTRGDSNVRPLHAAWKGTILPVNDPWWETHTGPNGYGCRCYKSPTAESPTGEAPEIEMIDFKNPTTGIVEKVPIGIDPGFAYNPADAAWGRSLNKKLIDQSELGKFTDIKPLTFKDYERPATLPLDSTKTIPFVKAATNEDELKSYLAKAIGGEDAYMVNPLGENIYLSQAITDHIMEDAAKRLNGRELYFPFIKELIEDPYEIWVNFAREEATGRVLARQKYVKRIQISKSKTIGLVADSINNMWTGLTFFTGNQASADKLRFGRLIYGR